MIVYLPTPGVQGCSDCGSDPCAGEDICDLAVSASGGDAGFSQTYASPSFELAGGDLLVTFSAFSVPDRCRLFGSGGILYDSGYIGTAIHQPSEVSAVVAVPAGTTWVRVEVDMHPDYHSTAWDLSITCAQEPP